jgi:DMSO/TMAO reductase YedYZ molybdopterin-dependent catalytic subunit
MSEDKQIRIDKVRELLREKGDSPWAGGSDNTANVIGEHRYLSEPVSDAEAKHRMSAMSRRGFLVGGVTALAGIFGWRWMSDETKASLFRRTFEFNEKVSQKFYSPTRLAPEFPLSSVSPERVNGMEGLEEDIDVSDWKLAIGGLAGRVDDLMLTLDDIKKLPRTEMTTEFKCIEGWSVIVHWAGARFSDLAAKYLPQTRDGSTPDVINRPQDLLPYVALTTPDEKYFVGWDIQSILHPQTLLAYEMNGAPLTPEHGAPLRLASPTKYGIKNIKRIGRIEFTSERPRDFWAEYGYDWYSGH